MIEELDSTRCSQSMEVWTEGLQRVVVMAKDEEDLQRLMVNIVDHHKTSHLLPPRHYLRQHSHLDQSVLAMLVAVDFDPSNLCKEGCLRLLPLQLQVLLVDPHDQLPPIELLQRLFHP